MSSNTMFAQLMAPGGAIQLIPFTRGVMVCLFLLTVTVFIWGVARVHMAILGVLSLGMYIVLGVFQTEYDTLVRSRAAGAGGGGTKTNRSTGGTTKRRRPAVASSKRED